MQVLLLTQVLPYPLDAGPKVRAYHVLRHLASKHEVTLVSFTRGTDRREAIDHLAGICSHVLTVAMARSKARDALHLARSLATGRPFIIARDKVPAMERMVKAQCAMHKFDAVHADQLWMAPYALLARASGLGERPLAVLDQHNAVFLIPQRLAAAEPSALKRMLLRLEARKMARYEIETCGRFDRVVWVTDEDHAAVEQQAAKVRSRPAPVRRSAVIPICGDAADTTVIQRRPGARRVTFLGGLHWPPNAQGVLWFVQEVFPQILARVPEARLTVIGKDPPEVLQAAASGLPAGNVEVTGYVDDPAPYLEETAAFVVPLLAGGGMRVKIVDAWMWGMPVVSTSIGAEGIELSQGENILVADRPSDFAEAVVRLLQDEAEANRLGLAGRRWAEQRYDWRKVYPAWDGVYAGKGDVL